MIISIVTWWIRVRMVRKGPDNHGVHWQTKTKTKTWPTRLSIVSPTRFCQFATLCLQESNPLAGIELLSARLFHVWFASVRGSLSIWASNSRTDDRGFPLQLMYQIRRREATGYSIFIRLFTTNFLTGTLSGIRRPGVLFTSISEERCDFYE